MRRVFATLYGRLGRCTLLEFPTLIREHDLHAPILLPSSGRGIVRDRIALAATKHLQPTRCNTSADEIIGYRLGAPSRKLLVVGVGSLTVRVALDDEARIGILIEILRKSVDRERGARFEGSRIGVEQHIAQRHDHSALSLLGLQFCELTARGIRFCSLYLSRRLRGCGLLLRYIDFVCARLEQDTVAISLGLFHFIA